MPLDITSFDEIEPVNFNSTSLIYNYDRCIDLDFELKGCSDKICDFILLKLTIENQEKNPVKLIRSQLICNKITESSGSNTINTTTDQQLYIKQLLLEKNDEKFQKISNIVNNINEDTLIEPNKKKEIFIWFSESCLISGNIPLGLIKYNYKLSVNIKTGSKLFITQNVNNVKLNSVLLYIHFDETKIYNLNNFTYEYNTWRISEKTIQIKDNKFFWQKITDYSNPQYVESIFLVVTRKTFSNASDAIDYKSVEKILYLEDGRGHDLLKRETNDENLFNINNIYPIYYESKFSKHIMVDNNFYLGVNLSKHLDDGEYLGIIISNVKKIIKIKNGIAEASNYTDDIINENEQYYLPQNIKSHLIQNIFPIAAFLIVMLGSGK